MNYKRNNGGEMQPYIPKGNGEHSGEYTNKIITAESYIVSKKGVNLDKSFEIKHISSNKSKLRNVLRIIKDNNIDDPEALLDELYYINVEARRDYNHILEEVSTLEELTNHIYGMEKIYGIKNRKINTLYKKMQDDKIEIDSFNDYYGVKKIKGYSSLQDDLRKTNPLYGTKPEYSLNCIYSVITFMLRRFKKLDVTAKPVRMINEYTAEVESISLLLCDRQKLPLKDIIGKNDIIRRLTNYPNNCFFMMTVQWKKSKSGHAIAIEKHGDTIVFSDPQKGKILDDSFFNRIDKDTISIYRIDDIDYDYNILKCYKSGE